MSQPVYLFLHICMIHHYQDILKEMLTYMKNAGVWDRFDHVYYCAIGPRSEFDHVHKLMTDCTCLFFSENTALYERATLHQLHHFASESKTPFHVLYMHTKGVSRPPHRQSQIRHWRNYMMYFCCSYMDIALSLLERNEAKAVGVERRPGVLHFSGNFWWTTSETIRSLPVPIGPEYLAPELWIGLAKDLRSMYQYPTWFAMNTPFTRFSYENQIHFPQESIMFWENIPETTWYGRDHIWIPISKSEWPLGQFLCLISHDFWNKPDPFQNRLKIWRGVGSIDGKRFAIPEGKYLKIIFK